MARIIVIQVEFIYSPIRALAHC